MSNLVNKASTAMNQVLSLIKQKLSNIIAFLDLLHLLKVIKDFSKQKHKQANIQIPNLSHGEP
jgi:hypothetical protein